MNKEEPNTYLFCNEGFARIIFEDRPGEIYWLDLRDWKREKTFLHAWVSGFFMQIPYHPNVKQIIGVSEWMIANNIIWPFTAEERFLFELTFG